MEVTGLAALAAVVKQAISRHDLAVEMVRSQVKAEQSVVEMIVETSSALRQGRGQTVDIAV